MGTSARLTAVPDREAEAHEGAMEAALDDAEAELRSVEAAMSSWLDASELSALNRAPVGEPVPLSAETLAVLKAAQRLYDTTGGAFDVTCGPLIDLWREAADAGELPALDALERARSVSGWAGFELREGEAVRTMEGARIDLGGIAKGYAIDEAVETLREAGGVAGGLVDVGGDVRVFGASPGGGAWQVGLRAPEEQPRPWGKIAVSDGAVATSGHYARYFEIDGKRYSHIIDPRTGRPAEEASLTVTVVGPSALRADAWATALAVLGPEGLDELASEPGLEAFVVHGPAEAPRAIATSGFPPIEDLGGLPPVTRR
jgi:thiamine biosynthesis lipoprotein